MERYEIYIKKIMDGRKKLIINFLVIEFILLTIGTFCFINSQVDRRYMSIAATFILIGILFFIGFRKLNNDLLYCHEFYKVDKIQVIRKLKMENPLVKIVLFWVDHHQMKILIKKAHEAILYVNKYLERVELGPWMIDTDLEKNRDFKDGEFHDLSKMNTKLNHYLNQLGIHINYPIDMTKNNQETIIVYKVYGFLVNYTTIDLDEDEFQHVEVDQGISITLNDSNLESIKYDVDPYFILIVTIK